MTAEEIVAAALKLDRKTRGDVASRLIESLDEEEEKLSREEWEAAWAREIDRRIQEMDEGKVAGIPGEEVMRELRDLLA